MDWNGEIIYFGWDDGGEDLLMMFLILFLLRILVEVEGGWFFIRDILMKVRNYLLLLYVLSLGNSYSVGLRVFRVFNIEVDKVLFLFVLLIVWWECYWIGMGLFVVLLFMCYFFKSWMVKMYCFWLCFCFYSKVLNLLNIIWVCYLYKFECYWMICRGVKVFS